MQAPAAEPRESVDPTYDLFRSAICDVDPAAWTALATCLQPVVLSALRRLPGGHRLGDDEDWVYRALDRLWRAVPAARFCEFGDSGSLVRYVKMCATSVYLDSLRDQRRHATVEIEGVAQSALATGDIEAEMLQDDAAHELWSSVVALLKDDDERAIAYLSFVRGMTPREIRARDPRRFGSMAHVYQVKRRILERVRPRIAAG
jgi:DNA-directed RNA polymerase specialized sigma24 family protein